MQKRVRPSILIRAVRPFPFGTFSQFPKGGGRSHGHFPAVRRRIGIHPYKLSDIAVTEAVAGGHIPSLPFPDTGIIHGIYQIPAAAFPGIKTDTVQFGTQVFPGCTLQFYLGILPFFDEQEPLRYGGPDIHKKDCVGLGKPDSPGNAVRSRPCSPLTGDVEAVGILLHDIIAASHGPGNLLIFLHHRHPFAGLLLPCPLRQPALRRKGRFHPVQGKYHSHCNCG